LQYKVKLNYVGCNNAPSLAVSDWLCEPHPIKNTLSPFAGALVQVNAQLYTDKLLPGKNTHIVADLVYKNVDICQADSYLERIVEHHHCVKLYSKDMHDSICEVLVRKALQP
jgi:hypothetical protein